jgi:hypothetical protein
MIQMHSDMEKLRSIIKKLESRAIIPKAKYGMPKWISGMRKCAGFLDGESAFNLICSAAEAAFLYGGNPPAIRDTLNGWMADDCPLWYMREETFRDLSRAKLPDIQWRNVPWPLNRFALVMPDETVALFGKYNYGNVEHCTVAAIRWKSEVTLVYNDVLVENFVSDTACAGIDGEVFNSVIGSALYLSELKSEEMDAQHRGIVSTATDRHNRAAIPWIEDAARGRYRARHGGGHHASPEPHWRRAHYRMIKDGDSLRKIWVRISFVGGE